MMRMTIGRLAVGAIMTAIAASSASAQKAKDTLRLPFADPIGTILIYEDSKPEGSLTAGAVFDALLCFDAKKGSVEPLLASSWKWIDDRTLEMTMRQDIKFHDGSDFSAEDVAYTLNWLVDPNSKLRFTENFSWIDHTDLIDKHTVRIHANTTFAPALVRLATASMPMLPKSVHGDPAKRAEFGIKTPIGTGPYKAEYVDPNKGIMLVRNERYPQASGCKPAASIGRVQILPIPDTQTQIAQLTVGNLDYLKIPEKDQVDMLSANPALAVTALQGLTFNYMAIDASGRSGNKPLQDIRVRKALMQAIDRKLVTQSVVAGGDQAKVLDELCFMNQFGCDFSAKPDPSTATPPGNCWRTRAIRTASTSNFWRRRVSSVWRKRWPANCARSACAPRSTARPSSPTVTNSALANSRSSSMNGRREACRTPRRPPTISLSRVRATTGRTRRFRACRNRASRRSMTASAATSTSASSTNRPRRLMFCRSRPSRRSSCTIPIWSLAAVRSPFTAPISTT